MKAETAPYVSVQDHSITFRNKKSFGYAMRNFSFVAAKGEVVGVVGESGSGKSILGLSLLGLLPSSADVQSRETVIGGERISLQSKADLKKMRGPLLGMIFQDPVNSLDPCYTIGYQLREVLLRNPHVKNWLNEARSLLDGVGISDMDRRLAAYPHELSGGLCQRVQIALALAQNPKVLIADEPTTALDVTIQKQVMELLLRKRDEYGFTLILISHDLGLISQYCDRTLVIYAGEKMEEGPAVEVLRHSRHPYTRALLEALPYHGEGNLKPISGLVPDLRERPKGCVFYGRCERQSELCQREKPPLALSQGTHGFFCHHPHPIKENHGTP